MWKLVQSRAVLPFVVMCHGCMARPVACSTLDSEHWTLTTETPWPHAAKTQLASFRWKMILAVIADDKISLLYAKNKECKHNTKPCNTLQAPMKTSVETNSRLIQVVTTVHHKIRLLATSISLFSLAMVTCCDGCRHHAHHWSQGSLSMFELTKQTPEARLLSFQPTIPYRTL